MSFIVRRVLLTLLVPFAWKKWRNRSSAQSRSTPVR
jgi:hypothetical protein